MSCCISSAVCCALVTAAMSGIALGYNYSLAEYIDLKETNVSVYLKRGVFDDEISDDMEWRRSGHMPVQGHLRDNKLMTGPPANEEMPLRSGRRMDDSLVVSDDRHNFEGSLMRLTVTPPSYKSSPETVTSDSKIVEALGNFPSGSVDQIKAIQGIMNQRRANEQRNTKQAGGDVPVSDPPDVSGRRLAGLAPGGVPMFDGPLSNDPFDIINKARLAVPDAKVGDPANWFVPKKTIPESYRRTMGDEDYINVPARPSTFPTPIFFTVDMKRPTRPTRPRDENRPTHTTRIVDERMREDIKEVPEAEIERFKNKLVKDNQDLIRLQNQQFKKLGGKDIFQSEEDYAEQANNGLPIRKKRDTIDTITSKLNLKHLNTLVEDVSEDKSRPRNGTKVVKAKGKYTFNIKGDQIIDKSDNDGFANTLTVKSTNDSLKHTKEPNIYYNSVVVNNITDTVAIKNDSYSQLN